MTPYERAWRRAERTGLPAIYFQHGAWHVAAATDMGAQWRAAKAWVYGA